MLRRSRVRIFLQSLLMTISLGRIFLLAISLFFRRQAADWQSECSQRYPDEYQFPNAPHCPHPLDVALKNIIVFDVTVYLLRGLLFRGVHLVQASSSPALTRVPLEAGYCLRRPVIFGVNFVFPNVPLCMHCCLRSLQYLPMHSAGCCPATLQAASHFENAAEHV